MELNEEYHDPDYAGNTVVVKDEPQSDQEEDRNLTIRSIVRREFGRELQERENEVNLIDQRMSAARRLLHSLRSSLVTRYYQASRLQLSGKEELTVPREPWAKPESSSLRDEQRRIHPSVRKLLGRREVDLDEIFRHRAPRNNARKDYSAMLQTRNYTVSADKTKSLRPCDATAPAPATATKLSCDVPSSSRPKKVPRQIDPKVENVITLNDATRNQQKHRFRIIIGNTSKYAAPASRADRSTHKWLLYVRGPGQGAEGAGASLRGVVTAVTVTLHHSYSPHHVVHIDKPPYHISRRGWGEFPARVELHFALPHRNRPAAVTHTIKLDRNYTGLQTLGAETVVDVWLHCDEEMVKHEFIEDPQPPLEAKSEAPKVNNDPEPTPEDDPSKQLDSWLEFFNKDHTELDVDEMIIKAVKKEPQMTMDEENLLTNTDVIKREPVGEMNLDFLLDEMGKKLLEPKIKRELLDTFKEDSLVNSTENLVDSVPPELLNQPASVKKRIMKYMEPTTGRIYYLEMDRDLDLTKVQEIVINSKGNTKTAKISPIKSNGLKNVRKTPKKGVSLLKPEVTNWLKTEPSPRPVIKTEKTERTTPPKLNNYKHIGNDHCYLGTAWSNTVNFQNSTEQRPVLPEATKSPTSVTTVKKEQMPEEKQACLYEQLCEVVKRFSCERVAVNYLLRKIPLICDGRHGTDFWENMPFIVESEEVYWKCDFAKRRNIEWSRAKTIHRILSQHSTLNPTWRTKQILLFSRLHGYCPVREERPATTNPDPTDQWSSWNDLENTRKIESTIKGMFPDPSDINSLTLFKPEDYITPDAVNLTDLIDLTEGEEELDVVRDLPVKVKSEVLPDCAIKLEVLPVENEEDRLRFLFVERMCQDIGIELRNEDVGNGYSCSAVHAVLLTAMKCYAEELLRDALAEKRTRGRAAGDAPLPVWSGADSSSVVMITLRELWSALRRGRHTAGGAGRGVAPHTDTRPL